MAYLTSLLLLQCLLAFLQAHSQVYKPEKSIRTYIPEHPEPQNKIMNIVDSCWRSNPSWGSNRPALADCVIGFGNGALGGKNGAIYVVTDPSDDPIDPKPGTLRYGVIQSEPLWIIFEMDMVLTLENELIMNSHKTIDGRGVKVEISNGPCITMERVSNVIVHGVRIHDCKPGNSGLVRSTPEHVGHRDGSDGDAISVFASSNIWIDHCFFAHCTDGLIDIIHASTGITISNSYFTQHDKVMLLGHQDGYTADKNMTVTLVYNYFGPDLVQRIPRVRYGYAHVANNKYDEWQMYAIGGSSDPTILSEGNYFVASNKQKEVTKRETKEDWRDWKWTTCKDVFMNGAVFIPSGSGSCSPPYVQSQSFTVAEGLMVPTLVFDAGPLQCVYGKAC